MGFFDRIRDRIRGGDKSDSGSKPKIVGADKGSKQTSQQKEDTAKKLEKTARRTVRDTRTSGGVIFRKGGSSGGGGGSSGGSSSPNMSRPGDPSALDQMSTPSGSGGRTDAEKADLVRENLSDIIGGPKGPTRTEVTGITPGGFTTVETKEIGPREPPPVVSVDVGTEAGTDRGFETVGGSTFRGRGATTGRTRLTETDEGVGLEMTPEGADRTPEQRLASEFIDRVQAGRAFVPEEQTFSQRFQRALDKEDPGTRSALASSFTRAGLTAGLGEAEEFFTGRLRKTGLERRERLRTDPSQDRNFLQRIRGFARGPLRESLVGVESSIGRMAAGTGRGILSFSRDPDKAGAGAASGALTLLTSPTSRRMAIGRFKTRFRTLPSAAVTEAASFVIPAATGTRSAARALRLRRLRKATPEVSLGTVEDIGAGARRATIITQRRAGRDLLTGTQDFDIIRRGGRTFAVESGRGTGTLTRTRPIRGPKIEQIPETRFGGLVRTTVESPERVLSGRQGALTLAERRAIERATGFGGEIRGATLGGTRFKEPVSGIGIRGLKRRRDVGILAARPSDILINRPSGRVRLQGFTRGGAIRDVTGDPRFARGGQRRSSFREVPFGEGLPQTSRAASNVRIFRLRGSGTRFTGGTAGDLLTQRLARNIRTQGRLPGQTTPSRTPSRPTKTTRTRGRQATTQQAPPAGIDAELLGAAGQAGVSAERVLVRQIPSPSTIPGTAGTIGAAPTQLTSPQFQTAQPRQRLDTTPTTTQLQSPQLGVLGATDIRQRSLGAQRSGQRTTQRARQTPLTRTAQRTTQRARARPLPRMARVRLAPITVPSRIPGIRFRSGIPFSRPRARTQPRLRRRGTNQFSDSAVFSPGFTAQSLGIERELTGEQIKGFAREAGLGIRPIPKKRGTRKTTKKKKKKRSR